MGYTAAPDQPLKRSLMRTVCALALLGIHGAMWLLMDIGSFPPTMMAAATALLPAAFWIRIVRSWSGCVRTEEARPPVTPLKGLARAGHHLLIGFFALNLFVNIEGNCLRDLEASLRTP